MKQVVLFGLGHIAEVVHYYMTSESDLQVAAFTCDREYINHDRFHGSPVVPFDEVQKEFPPDRFVMFVALGYQKLNALRAERVAQGKAKGYEVLSFIHENSGLPKDTKTGENCFIMNSVCVHPRVVLGNNVFLFSGALVGHHTTIGDNCWITSNANIAGLVNVGRNCFFAINATVAHKVNIGDNCFIGANALVTKDLRDGQVVVEKSSEVSRLNSEQFLKMSGFS